MPSVFLQPDIARGWIGPSSYAFNFSSLFDGNAAVDSPAVALGNGVNSSAAMWNSFYLQAPSLPANAFPTQLQTTWFITQSLGETVYIQMFPEPYGAGEVRVTPPSSGLTAYPVNFSSWNAAWPLDGLRISVLASAATQVTEIIAVLYYTLPPSVGSLAVSPLSGGAVTTTVRPTVSWNFLPGQSDIPGVVQSVFQVRFFTSTQAAVGGFDPATSPATWDSGQVQSSASSYQVPINLANSTNYRAYVRVANTSGGQTQWSGWSSVAFTINIPPAAVPARPTITATADSTNARIALTVSQSTTPAWDHVYVQRSDDGGATWTTVRNGDTDITAGSTLSIWDYEAPNGTVVIYRAQAQLSTTAVGGFTQVSVSQWTAPTAAVSWSAAAAWLKSPLFPTLNTTVSFKVESMTRQQRRGVFPIVGAQTPIVVNDVRSAPQGQVSFYVDTQAELDAFLSIVDLSPIVLIQTPATWNWGSRYLALGDVTEERLTLAEGQPNRWFTVEGIEVDAPVGDAVMPLVVTPPVTGVTYLLDESGNRLTDESGNELTAN